MFHQKRDVYEETRKAHDTTKATLEPSGGRIENASHPFYFILTAFGNIGYYSYPAFVFCFLLYSVIVTANVIIILAISRERSLHQPMYVLIACLSVNSLYGSTGFFPRLLRDLLQETHLISRPGCFSQIYVIYTYASYEFTILSMMAYDRYVAVCKPLQYHSTMTSKMVSKLALFAWIYPAFSIGICAFLSFRLPLCGIKIPKVYCANWPVVKLSCVNTFVNDVVGMIVSTTTIFIPLLFVLYTYLQILLICRKRSAQFKRKVFQSCLPHVVTFFNYSITVFCDVTLSRLDFEEQNPILAVMLSLEFVVIPPILNPLMYGLKLPEMKRVILRLLCRNRQKLLK